VNRPIDQVRTMVDTALDRVFDEPFDIRSDTDFERILLEPAGAGRPGAAASALAGFVAMATPIAQRALRLVRTGSGNGRSGDGASGAVHTGDSARAFAPESRDARVDRGVHFVSERLPLLNQLARRSCGGTVGQRGTRVGSVTRSGELVIERAR